MLGSTRGGARFWPLLPPYPGTKARAPILKWEREGTYPSTKTGARFLPSTVLSSSATPVAAVSTHTHIHVHIHVHVHTHVHVYKHTHIRIHVVPKHVMGTCAQGACPTGSWGHLRERPAEKCHRCICIKRAEGYARQGYRDICAKGPPKRVTDAFAQKEPRGMPDKITESSAREAHRKGLRVHLHKKNSRTGLW